MNGHTIYEQKHLIIMDCRALTIAGQTGRSFERQAERRRRTRQYLRVIRIEGNHITTVIHSSAIHFCENHSVGYNAGINKLIAKYVYRSQCMCPISSHIELARIYINKPLSLVCYHIDRHRVTAGRKHVSSDRIIKHSFFA